VLKDRKDNPDLKESIEIGREGEEGYPNRWPQEVVGDNDDEANQFKSIMKDFFVECKDLHRTVMRAIALGLGVDEGFFDDFVKVDNTLRLLHYPSVKSDVFRKNKGQVRAGAHTDYGSITLLFQDSRGGLQVKTGDGVWKDVTPIEGTVIVNAGDLLARWSNDTIRSTIHRVVEPPLKDGDKEAEEYPARYSVAYFCNPDFDKDIQALPNTYSREEEKKYETINSGQYLVQRLQATY
jgi:isopenicillin N synthase-like dioxygenase